MFHLRLLAVTSLLASACVEDDPRTCPSQPTFRAQPLQVRIAGRETNVVVRAECKRYGASLASVHVTLRDASGAEVPFTMNEPTKVGETHSVTVSFVAPLGGTTVRAEFEPDLGDVEIVVVGMRDRTSERPVAELDLPDSCGSYHRAGGLVACATNALRVFVDGGLLAEEPAIGVREANEVLWSWSQTGVTRWSVAERLELATSLSVPTVAVSADDGRLVLDQNGDLFQFSLHDGGLERTALLLDAGVSAFFHPPIQVDGGWVWIDETTRQSCFRGPGSALSCGLFEYPVKAAQGDGFWVNDGKLGFARFGAGPRPISFVSVDQPLEVNAYPPRLQYGENAVSVRPDTMELEAWPAFPIVKVTPRSVFGVQGARVSIYAR